MVSGVPQGSVLGQLLFFCCYIIDLSVKIHTNVKILQMGIMICRKFLTSIIKLAYVVIPLKLEKEFTRTSVRKHFFAEIVIN